MSSPRQILSDHALVIWYNESLNDIETHTTSFWQMVFTVHFPPPRYILAMQRSPDGSLRRADGVLRFTPDRPGASVVDLLWLECKHAFGSAKEVEMQVHDAAMRYLGAVGADEERLVYAMTAIGPTFRLWTVGGGFEGLQPFRGDARRNDKSQYLDVKSNEGCEAFFAMRDDIIATHTPSR
jgi:hypothetical protein